MVTACPTTSQSLRKTRNTPLGPQALPDDPTRWALAGLVPITHHKPFMPRGLRYSCQIIDRTNPLIRLAVIFCLENVHLITFNYKQLVWLLKRQPLNCIYL